MSHHAIVKLTYHQDEFVRGPKLRHDMPQTFVTDSVKSLGEIHEDGVQFTILLFTRLLELSGSEDHVHRATLLTEAALCLG